MLSQKQIDILSKPLKDINLLAGVTGSGKSFVANLRFYEEILKIRNGFGLLTGNTSESLYKNVISELLKIDLGINDIEYTKSPARIKTTYGTEVFCVGVNNEGSEKRLRGGNIDFWYSDEVTTYPASAFDMCLSRCRGIDNNNNLIMKPALMTCNPDTEIHYIKTRFIDTKNDNIQYWEFGYKDNPTITDAFIEKIKAQYSGLFYERMILGKWCGDPEKLVIPEFGEYYIDIVGDLERPKYYQLYGALDPGFSDHTGYLLGYNDFANACIHIDGELFINKKNTSVLAEKIRELEKMYNRPVHSRVSDTSPQVIADLNQLHNIPFSAMRKVKGDSGINFKEAAINYLRVLIKQRKIKISNNCKQLIMQLKTCQWNENRTDYEKTEGQGHYDLMDALLYLVRSIDVSYNPYPDMPEGVTLDTHYIVEEENRNKELADALLNI